MISYIYRNLHIRPYSLSCSVRCGAWRGHPPRVFLTNEHADTLRDETTEPPQHAPQPGLSRVTPRRQRRHAAPLPRS